MTARLARRASVVVLALVLAATASADWLQPDASLREAQIVVRLAARDTAGHGEDPSRLDSLGVALLLVARLDEAKRVFQHVVELTPTDQLALGALGKLALFADDLPRADSLLALGDPNDPIVAFDRFASKMRGGRYAEAAEMLTAVNQEGRRTLLEKLAERPPYEVTAGPAEGKVAFSRAYPLPLVRVKLNGEVMLMALDTGAADLFIDESAMRRCKIPTVAGQSVVFWSGSRRVVQNALVQRLEIAGFKVENCPAGVINLSRWSLEVNPQSEKVAGVIGLNLLRKFTPTIDYADLRLVLRRPETSFTAGTSAVRVPFQIWGEAELMVWGTIAQGRRMGFVVQTGVPACGVGAPTEVFEEVGVKPGAMARIVKGAGQYLQGRSWAGVIVPSVSIGGYAKDRVSGWQGAMDASELWRHGVRRDALIAGELFKNHRLTIDWARHDLVIEE